MSNLIVKAPFLLRKGVHIVEVWVTRDKVVWSSKALAEAHRKDQGLKGAITRREGILIDKAVFFLEGKGLLGGSHILRTAYRKKPSDEVLRKMALEKLTEDEKRVLGLPHE